MKDISGVDDDSPDFFPDLEYYKKMIAKAILFKKATAIVRPLFHAFRANIVVYVIAMIAYRYGEDFDLMRIWSQQGISEQLSEQLKIWAMEINDVLTKSSNGRMISEWAKSTKCWDIVKESKFSLPAESIPEIKK